MANQAQGTGDHQIYVAIGASAGGLEAINLFFDHLKDTAGYSYIIIQHLSSDYKSFLAELVAKHTEMPVVEARNNMKVRKQCVYVIPNKMTMTVKDGKLRLLEKDPEHIPNNTIDVFLSSLAAEAKEKAVAVILSGTGSDGSRGVEHIKANGGMVLVQEPATAKFDGMPNSAILTGNADAILTPEAMPAWIAEACEGYGEGRLPEIAVSEAELQQLFGLLQQKSGHDFQYYKTPTILRRINKRMRMLSYDKTADYIDFIRDNRSEALELSKELFINVTSFFRDTAAFEALAREVIPRLVQQRKEGGVIKVWVCACSTGEEAYSIAILFDQYLKANNLQHIELKIFATDIDDNNITFAARNQYPARIAPTLPPGVLQDYFVEENGGYSVIPRIRRQIVFARHNVIRDPAFIKNDLISCRNMLIYMNRVLQEKILATFHFSLNPQGCLMLGTSESAAMLKEGFSELDGKWKLFQRNERNLATGRQHRMLPPETLDRIQVQKPAKPNRLLHDLAADFREVLSEQLGYTALYIDNNYEIRETIGNYTHYLSLPEKNLKLNLLAMLPHELEVVLGNAIRRAWYGKKSVTLQHVPFRASQHHYIDIVVKPAADPHSELTLIIIGRSRGQVRATPTGTQEENQQVSDQEEYIRELEVQLTDTRDNLQLAVEGLETSNEELQSANEELLSSNEELQSSNEELQSLNEELHTLNTEHQAKIKELIELNDDLDNYFRSCETGQIFLDAELNIRKFNPNACHFFNLIDSDIGRPISHISNNMRYPSFSDDLMQVQRSGKMIEQEIGQQNGKVCLVRIHPYQRKDKIRDGLVLSFIDITDVKNLYGVVNGVFDSSLNAIIVLSSEYDIQEGKIVDFRLVAVNYAAEALLENKKDRLLGQSFRKVAAHLLQMDVWEKLIRVSRDGSHLNFEYVLHTAGTEQYYDLSAVKINDGVMISYADTTQRKKAEKRLKKNYNELIVARESLRELNTRLEEEVADRTRELSQSEERFRLVSRATNDVIKDWDLVNNIVWHSESFFNLFRFAPGSVSDSIGFWFGHIHPEEQEQVRSDIFNAINTGAPQWTGEYRFQTGAGIYVHVLERGYILKDEAGMPYRMISSLMDITALKKAEEATRELLQKKDEFMSIASHELKTPITSMKASLQIVERIIEDDDNDALAKDFIRKANDQVDKLTKLVENLLDVTKIQSGKMAFNKSEFDISELIDDCVFHIQNLSRNPIRISRNDHQVLYADQNRIEQVVMNFLSNAVKYSPDTTIVTLDASRSGNEWKVSVKDEGIGISEENQPYVFDRFFRGVDSSEKFSGLGLGLYISADIIRRHGGSIGVDSVQGQGSTFWFTLPLSLQQQSPTAADGK